MGYRRVEAAENEKVTDVAGRAFRFRGADMHHLMEEGKHRYTHENARVWTDGEEIVAAAFAYQRAVTVEGRFLPAGLVGLVSVPPEQRRRGYAFQLMHGLLREWQAGGVALSFLYPYNLEFYRRLGYGIANHAWYLELPLKELIDFEEGRLVRRLTRDDLPDMRDLFERVLPHRNGWLERTDFEWYGALLHEREENQWPRQREMVGVPGDGVSLRGYLVYTLAAIENPPPGGDPTPVELHVHEWVSADDEAWRALAGFVAAQRAQAHFMRYTAPVGFPLPLAVRNRETFRDRRQTEFIYRDMFSVTAGLMGRVVNWAQALAERGWPPDVVGECVVQMRDPLLPENEAPLRLAVEAGRATVTPTDAPPDARADVSTWSELYTGTLSPAEARLLGRLAVDDQTLDFLERALATSPWLLPSADWF